MPREFMKISPATSLADIALLRGQYGVTRITVDIDCTMLMPVLVTLFAGDFQTFGRGETEAEAFDDAFARLQHRIGVAMPPTQDVIVRIGGAPPTQDVVDLTGYRIVNR